jgi:hypothetical protein
VYREESKVKKALAVVLFIVGAIFVLAALGSAITRMTYGLEPEVGLVLFMIAFGAVLIWGGVVLWRRP